MFLFLCGSIFHNLNVFILQHNTTAFPNSNIATCVDVNGNFTLLNTIVNGNF